MMHIPTAFHLNDSYVAPRLDISNDLEVRDNFGTDLVAACLHHPLFEPLIGASLTVFSIRPGWWIKSLEPQHIPVVVYPQKDTSSLKVGKCDQLLRQLAQIGRRIVLALDAGVFHVRDQLTKFCLCHRTTSKAVFATPPFECVLTPFEQLFHEFPNGSSIDGSHVFRGDLRATRIRLA